MCIFLILLINHSVLSELLSMPFLIASQAWFPQTFYITEMSKFYDFPFVVFGWIQVLFAHHLSHKNGYNRVLRCASSGNRRCFFPYLADDLSPVYILFG